MKLHLDDHCSGTLAGAVPAEYLAAHTLDICSVCGLLVSQRFNGMHPRCRPQGRSEAAGRVTHAGAGDPRLPDFEEIMACGAQTVRHVPSAARAAWAQCLARTVASAAALNTLGAWQELFMLAKAVLATPGRGGAKHRAQAGLAVRRRCLRWLAGERAELFGMRWRSSGLLDHGRASSVQLIAMPAANNLLLKANCPGLARPSRRRLLCLPPRRPSPPFEANTLKLIFLTWPHLVPLALLQCLSSRRPTFDEPFKVFVGLQVGGHPAFALIIFEKLCKRRMPMKWWLTSVNFASSLPRVGLPLRWPLFWRVPLCMPCLRSTAAFGLLQSVRHSAALWPSCFVTVLSKLLLITFGRSKLALGCRQGPRLPYTLVASGPSATATM